MELCAYFVRFQGKLESQLRDPLKDPEMLGMDNLSPGFASPLKDPPPPPKKKKAGHG